MAYVGDEDEAVGKAAIDALGAFGAAAVPHLRDLLQRHPEYSRQLFATAQTIGSAAAPVARDQLAAALRGRVGDEREWLVESLAYYGAAGIRVLEAGRPPGTGPALCSALRSGDPKARQAAARALITVRYVGDELLSGLEPMLRSSLPADVRWASYSLLAALEQLPFGSDSLGRVTGFLATGDVRLRQQVMQTLAGLPSWGDAGLAILTDGLLDPEAGVRLRALRGLARWGRAARAAGPAVELLREDDDARVRAEVQKTLAAISGKSGR